MRRILLLIALLACSKKAESDPKAAPKKAGPPPAAAVRPAAKPSGDDLLSLVSGVIPVDGPGGLEPTAREWAMIDQDPQSGWIQEERVATVKPIVFELPTRVKIKTLVVDEAKCDLPSRLVHRFAIEVSDKSATDGFQRIAEIKPDRQADGLVFPVTADVAGRWVRVVPLARKNPDEGTSEMQLMNLHAYGERLGQPAAPDVTGTYETENLGRIHLVQNGAQVTGCADKAIEPLSGVLEGRVLRLQWTRDRADQHGPLVMVFGDGGRMFGAYWNETVENPPLLPIDAPRGPLDKEACPQPKTDPLADELAAAGRVRLYGITFDLDSDKLRPESKPTLDHIAELLRATKGLRLRVEGHTDNSGTPDHNQKLSDARAASVKAYLVAAGIAADRLEPQGFGATRPAASNASELGRAANRRVELVKL